MEFQRYFRPKLSRNIYGHIYTSKYSIVTSSGGGSGSGSYIGGDYLPAKKNEDGTYTVTADKVTFLGDVISKKNVTAYGTSGEGGGGTDTGTTPTPSSTIVVDNLLSHSTEAALSANQGRILNEKIDNLPTGGGEVNLTDYYKKTEVNNLLKGKSDTGHTHPEYALKSDIPSSGGDVSNKLDKSVWDSAFTIEGQTIKCKMDFVGQKNVSAFGESTGTSSSSSTIIVDNLNSDSAEAALSARQGKVLKQMIDNLPSGGSGNLNGVYTRSEVNDLLAQKSDINHTHSDYATTTQLASKADETWVTQKIAEAKLDSNNVDLSSYAKKTDVTSVDNKVTDINNLFNENFTSEPSKLTVKKDTYVNGNLVVKGNVTAYQSDGTMLNFFYNPDSYDTITSTSKEQAVTPHTLSLLKAKLDDELSKTESVLSSFIYFFDTITTSSTLTDVTEAIASLVEDIQRNGYSLNNKKIKQ